MCILKGKPVPRKIRISVVVPRFNEFITSKLLFGALDYLRRYEVPKGAVTVAWVPGALKIPFITPRMTFSRRYDAIICLDAVIRGSTSHYDYVCSEVSKGITQISLTIGVPVMLSVLTTENIKQAIERAGAKVDNEGYDCTAETIEMVNLIRGLRQRTADDSLSATPPVQNADL